MNQNKNISAERLKQLFTTHPQVNLFYITSDGQAFTKEHFATAHAGTLEDKTIQPKHRIVHEKVEEVKGKIKANAAAKSETGTAPAADAGKVDEADTVPAAAEENQTDAAAESKQLDATPAAVDELEPLKAKYAELYGKKPSHLMKADGLKKAIAEKEAEASK